MSLKAFHAGLIWTGIVLIGALLIYYFWNNYQDKKHLKRYPPCPSYQQQPIRNQRYYNYQPRPKIINNKNIDIAMIICCWILPIIVTDYTPNVVYPLTHHLLIAVIVKTIVAFVFVGLLLYCSHYLYIRRYKINSILLKIYSGLMVLYGLYLAYNGIMAFYDLYKLKSYFMG